MDPQQGVLPVADVLVGLFIDSVVIGNDRDAILALEHSSSICLGLLFKLIRVALAGVVHCLDVYGRNLCVLAKKHPVASRRVVEMKKFIVLQSLSQKASTYD